MNSAEIKKEPVRLNGVEGLLEQSTTWLKEIAYQLAVMNERAAAMQEKYEPIVERTMTANEAMMKELSR